MLEILALLRRLLIFLYTITKLTAALTCYHKYFMSSSRLSFFEINWTLTYKSNDQMWLSDSINWGGIVNTATSDWTLASFIFQSSFVNQYQIFDNIAKFSYLDSIIVSTNLKNTSSQSLYNFLVSDSIIQTNTFFLPLPSIFQSEYQDTLSIALIIAPELANVINDYTSVYFLTNVFSSTPAAVFDAFANNINYFRNDEVLYLLMFSLYAWTLTVLICATISLKWQLSFNAHAVRVFYYIFSISRETRLQLEAVLQTFVFFTLYWIIVIMSFDDDREEFIELLDTVFFYIFSFIVFYLCYKYSIHYFAFLDSSEGKGRSVSFITKQFFKDFLNTFSLFLRFYILLFRINVYDTLDDFFDSYYIFVGDFDDDEYLNELFLSLHGTLLFTFDNQDDHSFLLEDENGFSNDFFYTYFVMWGKLFYFIFFMVEEAARLSLAFYICYLIIFEVHSVNCSYREDNFISTKKLNSILN